MDLHPIPRQITTFEFKLVGFMTIRQFGYVLLGGVFGYLVFLLIPVQVLNIFVGVLVGSVGLVFAFVPINDRPFEVFLRNLVLRLTTPTQYLYHKHNESLGIFGDMYFTANPHVVLAHAESIQKLQAYTQTRKPPTPTATETDGVHQARIHKLFLAPQAVHKSSASPPPKTADTHVVAKVATPPLTDTVTQHPVLAGTTVNQRHIPLPGVLLYVKDPTTGQTMRILKTNPHGVFATFHPLAQGEYRVEIVDPAGNYVFDPASVRVADAPVTNLVFTSKEMI